MTTWWGPERVHDRHAHSHTRAYGLRPLSHTWWPVSLNKVRVCLPWTPTQQKLPLTWIPSFRFQNGIDARGRLSWAVEPGLVASGSKEATAKSHLRLGSSVTVPSCLSNSLPQIYQFLSQGKQSYSLSSSQVSLLQRCVPAHCSQVKRIKVIFVLCAGYPLAVTASDKHTPTQPFHKWRKGSRVMPKA